MTDDQAILDRVRVLITSGHHRDEVLGRPGVALSGGGTFRGERRLYWRDTQEFATAEAEGLFDRLSPPPPPASRAAIEEAEGLVGAGLPTLLKELYAIANGGFGPGYGLETWLDGSLRQPWLIYDPETGTYRGATIAESQSALEPGS